MVKKTIKKATKKKAVEEEEEGGMDLDDAFSDDEDVEYAESKPRKIKKKKDKEDEEEKVEGKKDLNMDRGESVQVKGKNIEKLKKGDKIRVDGKELEIDAHYVMIDHGSTKEMAIECFNPKTDEDYQIRYFSDNVDNSMEFYKLDEIIYNRIQVKKIEW